MTDRLKMICSLIIRLKPNTTNLVLQKLLYFIQAASLCYFEEPAFEEEIEAWQYGPVVPEAYRSFKYNFHEIEEAQELEEPELKSLIKMIVDVLGKKNAFDLVNLTHSYDTWKESWKIGPGVSISKDRIKEFHQGLFLKNGFIF